MTDTPGTKGKTMSNEDTSAAASFGRSYPIDFSLLDENHQHVLYIDNDRAGHEMSLVIQSCARQSIELSRLDREVSSTNHHFALRFRPGVLADSTLAKLAVAEAEAKVRWKRKCETSKDGMVSVYLLRSRPRSLEPGESLTLTLQHVAASGASGARGTRVELAYRGLRYANTEQSIEGQRLQHLDIVNHRGQKTIPLHVGFVGSNTILNNGGAENSVRLRIANTLAEKALALNPSDNEAPSKLIISFDTEANDARDGDRPARDKLKDWALGTASEVQGIEIVCRSKWKVTPSTEGETPSWTLQTKRSSLPAGEHIDVTLNNIKSSLPSGHTNLYLTYENIPGYWDGCFVLVLEKSPMVVRGREVGIGTADPQAQLALGGRNTGEAGEPDQTQLYLGGRHNRGVNRKGIKLLIEGYNNDSASVYPIKVRDENDNDDFYIQSRPEPSGKPSMFFAGDIKTQGRLEDETGPVMPRGGIIMWSGQEDKIPRGWALCNGENETPDLRGRFIVGAGGQTRSRKVPSYRVDERGEPDQHAHEVHTKPMNLETHGGGEHRHRLPKEWYKRNFSGKPESYSGIDIRGPERNLKYTETDGSSHRHEVKIPDQRFTTESNAPRKGPYEKDQNRPRWYALCFIMKL